MDVISGGESDGKLSSPIFKLEPLFKPFQVCPASNKFAPFTIAIQRETELSEIFQNGDKVVILDILKIHGFKGSSIGRSSFDNGKYFYVK